MPKQIVVSSLLAKRLAEAADGYRDDRFHYFLSKLKYDFDLEEVKALLSQSPGVVVQGDIANFIYPMPLTAHEKDDTFVGRIRRDESQANTLNCWIVSDNLRKGAATNAVQIAEYLMEKALL